MAIIDNGILGGFKGKTGTVVGYRLNGQNIMRVVGKKRTSKPTKKELANRRKFATSQVWLKPLLDFLRIGFQDYSPKFQGFVAAKSYNSKHALLGEDPNFYIDPALALVSYGDKEQAEIASAVSESTNTITFSWETGSCNYNDRAMFLAYDIETGLASFDVSATRQIKKTGILEMDKNFSGRQVHVYLAFITEDRKKRSNSQYLGLVSVL